MTALRRLVEDPWFSSIKLGTVGAAWMIWAWRPSMGWALALAAAPWLLQVLAGRVSFRPTFLDVSLALFLLTAVVGLWVGYDRDGSRAVFSNPIGWHKLWGLLLAGLFYYALAGMKTPVAQRRALGLLVGLGAVVSMVFIATHDWAAGSSKWEPISRLGRLIHAPLPSLPVGLLNPNVAAGVVAPLLPLSLGLAAEGRRGRTLLWLAWGLLTGAIMALALLLTISRGAWTGLMVAGALAVAWWLTERLDLTARRLWVFAALVAFGGLAGILAIVGIPALRAVTLESFALTNRLNIFAQAALLVRDYPFTGCGLGSFALVHSTYALLIHVPILAYAHALLLDIAVEQGILGAVAAMVVWGGAGWLGLRELSKTEEPRSVLAAGLLSLPVLMIHGLVDDAVYGSWFVPLLWVPAGIVMATLRDRTLGQTVASRKRRLVMGGTLGVALLLFSGRRLAAAWYADLGAVAQTLVELPPYDYNRFDDPTLDQIRQREDLAVAEAYFERALALDPGQVTARTRLAHIALGRGEYKAALEHTQSAWEAGHRDRVTRLLLGDALVAQGRLEEAVAVVRGLEWAESRLNGQAWYRYWVGEDWQRAAYAWNTALILNPQDAYAAAWVEQAEERAALGP
jgi:O-antigen ligase